MILPTNPPIEIGHLEPELQAVALERLAREMAADRKALGLPAVTPPDPERLWCGHSRASLRVTSDVEWCDECLP